MAEQTKYRRHEAQYAQTGHSVVAFMYSCFGALGPPAIRHLWVLAMLDNMKRCGMPKDWIRWMIMSECSSVLIAIDPALLGSLLLWRKLLLRG